MEIWAKVILCQKVRADDVVLRLGDVKVEGKSAPQAEVEVELSLAVGPNLCTVGCVEPVLVMLRMLMMMT